MKRALKKFTAIFLSAAMTATALCSVDTGAELFPTENYTGTNKSYHNYLDHSYWHYTWSDSSGDHEAYVPFDMRYNWSNPVTSYLTQTEEGFMRFQSSSYEKDYLVEYYSEDFTFVKNMIIPAELPLFGGFYATADNYYILTGQENPEESNEVEVYRITKYDKNWQRLGSTGLYGANTTVPFDAGTARFDDDGTYLWIRTCHEMYTSSDGFNHQANVTIKLDMARMEITFSFYDVMNIYYNGYVSHSFNQFVKIDNDGSIVTVDHGDAHLRSVALVKYGAPTSYNPFPAEKITDMLSIYGDEGDNYTGVEVGGFEISDTAYIVAGNSVIQDENFDSYETNNIFVSVLQKDSTTPTITWITDYEEGEGKVSNPFLTKISDNSFLLIWEKDGVIYYTQLDGNGEKVSEIYSFEGALSDCEPVVMNGEVIWYVWENYTDYDWAGWDGYVPVPMRSLTYYAINTEDISKANTYEFNSVLGDTNGDGVVSELDSVALARYLAQWDVTIDEKAADLDGDGSVTELDSVILARRLAGWNV